MGKELVPALQMSGPTPVHCPPNRAITEFRRSTRTVRACNVSSSLQTALVSAASKRTETS